MRLNETLWKPLLSLGSPHQSVLTFWSVVCNWRQSCPLESGGMNSNIKVRCIILQSTEKLFLSKLESLHTPRFKWPSLKLTLSISPLTGRGVEVLQHHNGESWSIRLGRLVTWPGVDDKTAILKKTATYLVAFSCISDMIKIREIKSPPLILSPSLLSIPLIYICIYVYMYIYVKVIRWLSDSSV